MEKSKAIEILNAVMSELGVNPNALSKSLGKSRAQGIYDVLNPDKKTVGISKKLADEIVEKYPQFSAQWLLTGEGEMLKGKSDSKKLIPFYDDVTSIGGNIVQVADMRGVSAPAEYIDAGDWFKDATAAIRHYGDSMTEYPSGCILALRAVNNIELLVPGEDYVIETSEYRVTKRMLNKSSSHVVVGSTNRETYADGKLMHGTFEIPLQEILRIYLVLGHVAKKNSGTIVFNSR